MNVIEPQLAQAERAGLLARDHLRMAPTAKGQRFLNDLLEKFLAAPPPGPRARVISICSRGTARP
jgi:coproporphyrinogen III oxidase-like Fe-S oxidoreductase